MDKVKDFFHSLKNFASKYKILLVISITLLLSVPLMFIELEKGNRKAGYVASVTVMMGCLWLTELIPLYVTSLLPLILLPFFQGKL